MHPIRRESKGWYSQTGGMCASLFSHHGTEQSKDGAQLPQVADVMIAPAVFKLIKYIFSFECLSGRLPRLSVVSISLSRSLVMIANVVKGRRKKKTVFVRR